MSEREAREKLCEAGFASADVDTAMSAALDAGWLGDATFARLWIEDRLAHHPMSRRAVEDELRGRQVPHEVIAAALDEHYPAEREHEVAGALARARLGRLAGLDGAVQERRAIDFLLRRGFSSGVARDSVRRARQRGGDD